MFRSWDWSHPNRAVASKTSRKNNWWLADFVYGGLYLTTGSQKNTPRVPREVSKKAPRRKSLVDGWRYFVKCPRPLLENSMEPSQPTKSSRSARKVPANPSPQPRSELIVWKLHEFTVSASWKLREGIPQEVDSTELRNCPARASRSTCGVSAGSHLRNGFTTASRRDHYVGFIKPYFEPFVNPWDGVHGGSETPSNR